MVTETISKYDDSIIDYYPRFHCEFIFIQLYFGQVKRYSRRNCDYSFSGLQRGVPMALKSVPLPFIRRYARQCFRYMDAYRPHGQNGRKLTMK